MSCSLHESGLAEGHGVQVNGVTDSARSHRARSPKPSGAKPLLAWQAAARALVIRELLLQEARRLAIEAEPKSDAGRRETDEEALIRALIEREVDTPEPDEEACRRYYVRTARVSGRRQFSRSRISCLPPTRGSPRRSPPRSTRWSARRARQSPHRFAELAQARSACPSAAQGGNLGQITAGQTTPEFEEALRTLPAGRSHATPVVTRYGLHIIRLDRKIDGRELPFEAVAGASPTICARASGAAPAPSSSHGWCRRRRSRHRARRSGCAPGPLRGEPHAARRPAEPFRRRDLAREAVLALGDLALVARLREAADADGMAFGTFAAGAVRRYAAEASDEEWTTLMGVLARAPDPGSACLRRALAYVLEPARP